MAAALGKARPDFRAPGVRLQKQALDAPADGFTGVVSAHLSEHAQIAVEALRNILQRSRIDRRSVAFPRPDFLLALREARSPQINAPRFDDEARKIDASVGEIEMFLFGCKRRASLDCRKPSISRYHLFKTSGSSCSSTMSST